MIITDARKEIINLVSDYMNKTLSEWCLFIENKFSKEKELFTFCGSTKYWKTTYNCHWTNSIYDYVIDYISNYNTIETQTFEIMLKDQIKIIWHYDITAVSKYIAIQKQIRFIEWGHDNIYFFKNKNDILIWKYILEIPNKAIHLYTEDEDKKLLKDLKSL
jgi:hypothetical protein